MQINSSIKSVGIVLRPSTLYLEDVFINIKQLLKANQIESILDNNSINELGIESVNFNNICNSCDAILTLGGDGTLISVIRRSLIYQKPILGINMGRLGFLTAFSLDGLSNFAGKLKEGRYLIQNQLILEGNLSTTNNTYKNPIYCVNEFLISRRDVSGIIEIIARVNDVLFNTYLCDGLIIGTPAGSTAYNISAGGAIVYPYTNNVLLTPVCAHSLTQRPIVLNDTFNLEFELKSGIANIIIDGQEIIPFTKGDKFNVKVSTYKARLIYDENRNYFKMLREKFNWGDKN